jgi:hypothetical protein
MPTVPRLQGQQVQSTSTPGVRVNTDAPIEAFGGGAAAASIGRAAQGLASQANEMFLAERRKANDIATQEAWAKTTAELNRLKYDPKAGAFNRKGKDAFTVSEEYGKQFDAFADSVEEGLSDDEQRQMYRQMRTKMRLDLTGDLEKHTFQEAKRYEDETTESTLATSRDDAILNYQDPEKLARNLQLQQSIVMNYAERNGLPPEAVKAKLAEEHSKTHSAVVNRMLANGDDLRAKDYFEANRSALSGTALVSIEKSLEEGTLRGESQRQADQISQLGLPMSQALARAKAIEDPKLRDATLDRVKQDFTLKEAAKREWEESTYLRATTIIEGGGRFEDIPPHEIAQMPMAMRTNLQNYARQKVEGKDPEAFSPDYYDLRRMAASPETRADFKDVNLLAYKGKIKNSELEALTDIQMDLRKGGSKGTAELDGIRSNMQIVQGSLTAAGFDPTPKPGSTEAERVNQFMKQVDENVSLLQQQTGRKVTNEELQNVVDGLLVKGVDPKTGFLVKYFDKRIFAKKKHAFEVTPDEEFEIEDVKSIPAADRSSIEASLKRRNKPITEANILKLYTTALRSKPRGN